jgi:hypothetical protein
MFNRNEARNFENANATTDKNNHHQSACITASLAFVKSILREIYQKQRIGNCDLQQQLQHLHCLRFFLNNRFCHFFFRFRKGWIILGLKLIKPGASKFKMMTKKIILLSLVIASCFIAKARKNHLQRA